MSLKLSLLSPNLIEILMQCLNCQNLCKLLYYNNSDPLSQTNLDLPALDLLLDKIFPYPFDVSLEPEDCTQLRVYYPSGDLDGEVIEMNAILFDIIISNNLYLINSSGISQIRPYEILKEIINIFYKQSYSTLGRLKFTRFVYVPINTKYSCIRLIGNNYNIGTG